VLGQVTKGELNNGVINACFMLLFKDLIRLLACYNDGIISLLGTYQRLLQAFYFSIVLLSIPNLTKFPSSFSIKFCGNLQQKLRDVTSWENLSE